MTSATCMILWMCSWLSSRCLPNTMSWVRNGFHTRCSGLLSASLAMWVAGTTTAGDLPDAPIGYLPGNAAL